MITSQNHSWAACGAGILTGAPDGISIINPLMKRINRASLKNTILENNALRSYRFGDLDKLLTSAENLSHLMCLINPVMTQSLTMRHVILIIISKYCARTGVLHSFLAGRWKYKLFGIESALYYSQTIKTKQWRIDTMKITEKAQEQIAEYFKDKEVTPVRVFLNSGG